MVTVICISEPRKHTKLINYLLSCRGTLHLASPNWRLKLNRRAENAAVVPEEMLLTADHIGPRLVSKNNS